MNIKRTGESNFTATKPDGISDTFTSRIEAEQWLNEIDEVCHTTKERHMGQTLVIHMTPHEIECGMCGETDNHDHPDDRKAVPILNGEPTTSEGECDGYNAVCAKCYNRWDAWDERMKR